VFTFLIYRFSVKLTYPRFVFQAKLTYILVLFFKQN